MRRVNALAALALGVVVLATGVLVVLCKVVSGGHLGIEVTGYQRVDKSRSPTVVVLRGNVTVDGTSPRARATFDHTRSRGGCYAGRAQARDRVDNTPTRKFRVGAG